MMRHEPNPRAATARSASNRSRWGLDWFAFFLADVQTGFGPFLSVYLTTEKWNNADIGYVLTIGTLIALVGQLPGGALVDSTRKEKLVGSIAMALIGASALSIALWPQYSAVFVAQVLHAGASVVVGPALAAISLALVGHAAIGERLGRNARFASSGSVIAAGLMGVCGHYFTSRSVFFVTAVMTIPALFALHMIRAEELRHPLPPKQPSANKFELTQALTELWQLKPLLILAAVVCLFHLSNAAVLPLIANTITLRSTADATGLVALCIIVPQVLVAILSPWVGRYADLNGRRPLLLVGFGALPVRAVLLSWTSDPATIVALQLLDGISAAALGVLVSGAAADITRQSGHYTLALGCVGVAMGMGAATSTTVAGLAADHYGTGSALLMLAALGLVAFLVLALAMPETKTESATDDWR
jgi:MFS family permease